MQLLIKNVPTENLKKSPVLHFALERIKQRYNDDNNMSGTLLLGIPLPADLEGPVLEFFKDHPILFFSGYGNGNNQLIPDYYFRKTYVFKGRKSGILKGHLDMGVFFWLFEFGLLPTLYLYFIVTSKKISLENHFQNKCYIIVFIMMLFFRLEYIIAILFNFKNPNVIKH